MTVLLGYPLALWLTRMPLRWRPLGFAVILIPLLTNVVVRSLGIVLLLAPDGLINQVLAFVGLPPFARHALHPRRGRASRWRKCSCRSSCWRFTTCCKGPRRACTRRPQSLGASRADALLANRSAAFAAGPARRRRHRLPDGVDRLCLGDSARRQEGLTIGMLVWQEALQNLNAPLAVGARPDPDRRPARCSPRRRSPSPSA